MHGRAPLVCTRLYLIIPLRSALNLNLNMPRSFTGGQTLTAVLLKSTKSISSHSGRLSTADFYMSFCEMQNSTSLQHKVVTYKRYLRNFHVETCPLSDTTSVESRPYVTHF